MDELQLDLACAIVRMEQAAAECGTALGDLLVERLATCDARRLRQYVTQATWDALQRDDARPPE